MCTPKHTPGPWSVPHFAAEGVEGVACNCRNVLSGGYAGAICTLDVDNGLPIEEDAK